MDAMTILTLVIAILTLLVSITSVIVPIFIWNADKTKLDANFELIQKDKDAYTITGTFINKGNQILEIKSVCIKTSSKTISFDSPRESSFAFSASILPDNKKTYNIYLKTSQLPTINGIAQILVYTQLKCFKFHLDFDNNPV